MNVVELEIGGNDKQDKREGYNKIKIIRANETKNGITFTNNGDGSYTLNGTNNATGAIYFNLNLDSNNAEYFTLTKNKKYYMYLKGLKTGTRLMARSRNEQNFSLILSDEISKITEWTKETATDGIVYIEVSPGTTFNNETFYPMLAESETELPYEPYGAMPSPSYPSEVETVGSDVSTFDLAEYLNAQEFEINQYGYFGFAKLPDNFKSTIRMNATEITKTTSLSFGLIDVKSDTISENLRVLQTNGSITEKIYNFSNSENVYFFIADQLKFKQEDLNTILTNYNIEVSSCASVVVSNKNFLKITSDTRENTGNGVQMTVDDDGLITLNGTATAIFWPDLLWGIHNNTVNHDFCKYKTPRMNKATFSLKHISGTINQNNMFITAVFNDNSDLRVSLTAGSSTTNKVADGDIYGINRAYLSINTGMVFNNYKFYLQLEEGDTETDFVVPEEQTKTVDIQQEMLEGDYFVKEEDGWKEVHGWAKVIAGETEINATYFDAPSKAISDTLDTAYFQISSVKLGEGEQDKTLKNNIKSNYFKNLYTGDKIWGNVSTDNSYLKESIALQVWTRLRIKKERLEGYTNDLTNTEKVALLNNYIQQQYNSGNPIYFWYKLATPTKLACTEKQVQQLEDLLNTSTYKNVTHIYSTDKVSPVIKIKYRKDIETMFNTQQSNYDTRLSNIEKLLATTTTSAMLLDNLQTDIQKEVM